MRYKSTLWTITFAMLACAPAWGSEPVLDEPAEASFLHRLHPAGGWHPYGGGLFHWWKRSCFPCGGARDDYCRKPLPKVCWPAYPANYTWGPPELCYPQCNGHPECSRQR
jgi:hypothetical protein